VAAIQALEKLQPTGEWRKHLKYECYVPAGKFIIGEGEQAHEVDLDAFYIGKYPVTNAEYKRCMDDQGRKFEIKSGKANHPVVSVTWHNARDYVAWAEMRLLTEAEWEKAARWQDARGAGSTKQEAKGKKRKYPWGDRFDKDKCNTRESGIHDTTPVGKYSPQGDSPYGCADMAGNVFEWTSSLYKDYPYKTDDGREDMSSLGDRVLRGGSLFNYDASARASFRRGCPPSNGGSGLGFRCGA
jgi:formylglycine-generating enzyme required for sulfatase activity